MKFLHLFILQLFFLTTSAQIYHYKTNKIIPHNDKGIFCTELGIFDNQLAEYSVLLTPENHQKKKSRLINIPIIRIRALDTTNTKEPIFLLHGGPGQSNLQTLLIFDSLIFHHDIIIIGYRGVDGQVILNCYDNIENKNSLNNADSCISKIVSKNIDIKGYTINQIVKDIELVRQKYHYKKISFLAFSFGSVIAQKYANEFNQNIKKQLYIAPRPVNNLEINPHILNNQICKLYNYYVTTDTSKMSNKEIINHLQNIIIDIKKNKNINSDILLLAIYHQLYSTKNIKTIIEAINSYYNKDYTKIKDLCNDFVSNKMNKIIWGDVYLKKQDKPNNSNIENKNNIGEIISANVNKLYNPNHSYKNINLSDSVNISCNNLYMIFGELDIASPRILWRNILVKNVCNYSILNKTGHFDFFLDKKNIVENLIIDFLK